MSDQPKTPEALLTRVLGDTPVTGREHAARDEAINDVRRHHEERHTWPATDPLDLMYVALLDAAIAAAACYLSTGLATTVGRRAHATMAECARQLIKTRTSIDETERKANR